MKITTILGSPRRNGNTAAILKLFEDLTPATDRFDRINITDYSIKGCLGCDACRRNLTAPGCVQRDGASAILQRLLDSDLIVYATPLYVWGFTAQMKALLDRHYCLTKWVDGHAANALLRGKRAALLVTCGDAAEGNADLIQGIFDREMRFLGCETVGKYIVGNCTTPDKLGSRATATAELMWRDISALPPQAV